MQKNLLTKLIFKYRWELLFILISAFLHLLILVLPNQLAFGDLAPFPETWKQGFIDFFYAWRDISFGIYRHPGNITNLLQSFLVLICGSPLVAQKIYVVFLLPITAFLSTRYLLKKHFGAENNLFLFVSAFLYTYSPAMITEFVGGTQYSTMLVFALFPLVASLTIDVLFNEDKKSKYWLLLILSLLFSIDAHLVIIYSIFLGISILSAYIGQISKNNIIATTKTSLVLALIVLLAVISNPIYMLSNFSIVSPPSQADSNVGFANNLTTFINDVKYTYSRSSIFNTIRLGGNLSDFKYTSFSIWTTPFLLISLVTLLYSLYLFKASDSKRKIFVSGYMLISLFIYLTYLGYTYSIFSRIPILFIFRNPAKLTLLNSMFFLVCFYNTFNKLNFKINRIIYSLIYFAILIYLWPIFLLDRGLSFTRSDFTIPNEFYDIQRALSADSNNKEYRTLWIPSTYETHSIKLTWLDRGRIEDQLGFSEFATDNYGTYIVKALSNSVVNNDPELFDLLLKQANVHYVILTKDDSNNVGIHNFYSTTSINSGYKKLDSFLKDHKHIYENDYYKVYKLENTPNQIYQVSKVNELNYKSGNSIYLLQNIAKKYTTPFVKDTDSANEVLVAKLDNDDLSNHVIEWDDSWSWPEPTLNPQIPIYNLVVLKEKIGFDIRKDQLAKVNLGAWIISKRAAEVKNFNIRGKSLDKLLENVKYYADFIDKYYKDNEASTDLQRDTAVQAYVYLNKSKNFLGSKGELLNDSINIVKKRIDEGYSELCSSNCLEVKTNKPGAYYDILNTKNSYNLKSGINQIKITEQDSILSSQTVPQSTSPLIYQLDNLEGNKKYLVEFDYETKGDIYKLTLFTQYKNYTGVDYKYDSYMEYLLTSDFTPSKHFKAFFQPHYRENSTTLLKIEVSGQKPGKTLNINNLKVTPVQSNSVTMINNSYDLSNENSQVKNIDYIKKSPVEYQIPTKDIVENSYLIFAQNFNEGWELFNQQGKRISNDSHKIAQTYANAWFINKEEIKDSEYISIRFSPQRQLMQSYAFSVLFLAIIGAFIIKRDKIK